MKEMKKMGRTLGNSSFSRMLSETENARIFVLKSGAEARFTLTKILHDDIEAHTYVDPAINGRDQTCLTPESVSDISRTITLQQFFPAIGREVEGRIEVLDGSRRRAACLYSGMPFEVLITRDALTLADARQLAIDIQTAREHTLRELGMRLKTMYPADMTRAEIAAAEGLSPAKVTRAFQAAEVPDALVALFPSLTDLAISDYQALLESAEKAQLNAITPEALAARVREKITTDVSETLDEGVLKTRILAAVRHESRAAAAAKPAKKITVEKLAGFADKKQFARKKTDTEKRLITYEFSRLPAAWQAELDAAVQAVIEKMAAEAAR